MLESNIKIRVAKNLTEKGIKVGAAIFEVSEISRRQNNEFKKYSEEILQNLDIPQLLNSQILEEYKKFYISPSIKESTPPAEHLLKIIERSKNIPNINRVVDSYNIVSAETLLSIGAHDINYIKGNISFQLTNGEENYTPLEKIEYEKVEAGEYACMDEEKIPCRMDIKQCNETKITTETKQFIIYVEGNNTTSQEYVLAGLQKVCENIKRFCNAEYLLLDVVHE